MSEDQETANRTIAIPSSSVRELEQEFPALLNFQERVRYCVQYTLKDHESSVSHEEIEEIIETIIEHRDGDRDP